jgi:hypothetical protein
MMLINLQIASYREIDIEQAVLGDTLDHMIEESYAGSHLRPAGSVDVQYDIN